MEKLEKLIRALEVNKAVYEAVREYIKPGVNEREIYELTKTTVDKMLCDVSHEFIGDFVGGKRCALIGGDATDYKLSAGDGFILDLSVRCEDTWSDTAPFSWASLRTRLRKPTTRFSFYSPLPRSLLNPECPRKRLSSAPKNCLKARDTPE